MKISVNFSELQSVLGYTNTVLNDKSVEDKLKNLIFLVSEEEVKLVGYNAFTFSRNTLEKVEIEDVDNKGWHFQVKASEVNKLMSSFSSMYKTKVEILDFEDDGVKTKVTVHEVPINAEDEKLAQDSVFQFENPPIPEKIMREISLDLPEDMELFSSGDLLLYVDSLFPLINNDSASSSSSKINFADDYVFVITNAMSAFMQNKLPDAFKGLTLSYSSVNFLKKLCENTENIGVARLDKCICIQSDSMEAFMKFQVVKPNYKMYVEKRSKEKGIVIDRLYLKDVLKRMSNISPDGKMYITEENTLHVANASFEQDIPLENMKEGTEGINFSIPVPVLDKIIIGKDEVFPDSIFMYFVPTARGYILYVSDETGSWFSNTQVARA